MKKIIGILMLVALLLTSVTAFASCGTRNNGKVKVIDIKLSDEEYAFAVKKSDTELMTSLNAFLAEIKENGEFDKILDKYFGEGEPTAVVSAAQDTSNRAAQLWVATSADFPPFESREGNNFYGVDMEIISQFAEKIDRELVILDMDFDSVFNAIEADRCDIIASGLTVSEARKETVNFSNTYYNASQVLVVPENDTTFDECKTKEDVEAILKELKKKDKIGVQSGTTGQSYVDGDEDMGFDGLTATSKGFTSGALAVEDMNNGKIKYVIIDEAPANEIAKKINALK